MCSGDEDVCNEGEVCFARRAEDLSYEYACYNEPPFTFPGFSHSIKDCLDTGILLDYSSLLCCNSTDFCNRYLDPPIPPALTTAMAPETSTSLAESNPTTGPLRGKLLE